MVLLSGVFFILMRSKTGDGKLKKSSVKVERKSRVPRSRLRNNSNKLWEEGEGAQ